MATERDALTEGARRLRGEVAADPGLADDEERFARLAAATAADLEPAGEARERLERRLRALRDSLRTAGS